MTQLCNWSHVLFIVREIKNKIIKNKNKKKFKSKK